MKKEVFKCEVCHKNSLKKGNALQRFCGSLVNKTGCSYKNRLEYMRNYMKKYSNTPHGIKTRLSAMIKHLKRLKQEHDL